jgi:hypothetical protein
MKKEAAPDKPEAAYQSQELATNRNEPFGSQGRYYARPHAGNCRESTD